eukprot:947538-Rhodomonas_salina.2
MPGMMLTGEIKCKQTQPSYRACYAMPGTEISYGVTSALMHTRKVASPLPACARCALCGTELAYVALVATRCA